MPIMPLETEEHWDLERPERSGWLEDQLVEKIALSAFKKGSDMTNVARHGFTGVSEMTDKQFYDACRHYSVLRVWDDYYIYQKPVNKKF